MERPGRCCVQVVATVDSDWTDPVRIEAPPGFVVDEATPIERSLPPIRKTLQQLLAHYRQMPTDKTEPAELAIVPDLARKQVLDDLQSYLDAGIPPQGITWSIQPPDGADGMFAISATAGEAQSAKIDVVFGDRYPPSPAKATMPNNSPIKSLAVFYSKSKIEPVFWRPFAQLADHPSIPFSAPILVYDRLAIALFARLFAGDVSRSPRSESGVAAASGVFLA